MAALTVLASSFKDIALKLWEGGLLSRSFTHPSSTDLGEAGDIVKFYALPRNAKIEWGRLRIPTALDTGAGLVLSVELTDGTTVKTLIHETDIGQAGGLAEPSTGLANEDGVGFVIPSDGWEARVIVDTGVGTAEAAGDVNLYLSHTMYLETGERVITPEP